MLLAPSRGWENANGMILIDLNSGCIVYSNSLIPGPEMTSFLSFDFTALLTHNLLLFKLLPV